MVGAVVKEIVQVQNVVVKDQISVAMKSASAHRLDA